MSSPISIPYALQPLNQNEENNSTGDLTSATNETVDEKTKGESYKKFMNNFMSNNKVEYYCNKTLSMRQPLYEILDDLAKLQYYAMAYVPQEPFVTDHYALSMIFTLISKTASMVEWNRLNRDCFWKDFRRETRQLKFFMDRIQGVALECVHTATERANRALEILNGVVPIGEKTPDERLKSTMFQSNDEPSQDVIKIMIMEPRETVIIQCNDFDEGIQSIKLQQTGMSFRLRFLRYLIFYARKCLELTMFTLLRVDVALRIELPLDKLQKCQGLTSGQLLPHEKSALSKAKMNFDGNWDDIWGTVTRFKMQLDQLQRHKFNLKQFRKNSNYGSRLEPYAESLMFNIEDPLLFKVISQAVLAEVKEESYDFTMFSDRTEDLFGIIEDMWTIEKTSYKKIDMLIILLYTALAQVQPVLDKKEENILRKDVNRLFIERNRVKRYLKTALEVFKHKVFIGMALQQTGYTQLKNNTDDFNKIRATRSDFLDNEEDDDEENEQIWIELQEGYKVSIGDEKEFLVMNQFKSQVQFNTLGEEQKVVLTTKMLGRLLHYVSIEGCKAKIVVDRATETKSLLKRMQPSDRSTEYLGIVIGNGVYHIQQLLKLMKNMNVIRSTPL